MSGLTTATGITATSNITGGAINNSPIGGTTPSTGSFTTVSANTLNVNGNTTVSALTVTGSAVFTTPTSKVQVSNANAAAQFAIEQQSTGDSSMQFLIAGVRAWAIGIDNSDADKFKIAAQNDGFATPAIDIATDGTFTINTSAGFGLINQASSAGAQAATLLNSPVAGNPNFWLEVRINGTIRKIPAW